MLRRFWVEPQFVQEDQVTFEGDSFHHLIRVSRKKIGDEVEVLDGRGEALRVRLESVDKNNAWGRILSRRPLAKPKGPYLHLAFCMPKPANFELVLEKSVELGVTSVRPLLSQFSFYKAVDDFSSNKWERWERIIKSATEQSGRADLLSLEKPQQLSAFIESFNHSGDHLGLFLYEGESPRDLRAFLKGQDLSRFQHMWALVGSEGGFALEEVKRLKERGFEPLTMGEQILRTETACVSILSVLKYEFDLMR
jgi:16S rRNA (uracil1498-N3)-methyltransferase